MKKQLETHSGSDWLDLFRWLTVCLMVAPVTLILHELFHFVVATILGAEGLSLHWLSVSYDVQSLTNSQIAAVSIAGPICSWLFVVLSYWLVRKSSPSSLLLAFLLCAGMFANLRSLVGLGPLIRTSLGHTGLQFSGLDEWEFAQATGINWIVPISFSLIVFLSALVYFGRLTLRKRGKLYLLTIVFGYFLGLILYTLWGPLILPGGAGFS